MDKVINYVRVTNEYSKFKKLKGNRSIDSVRVTKIRESVSKVGFVDGPIVVNEKYEVIDGQGRLEVCQSDGIPVPYIVITGIGIDECIAMNINQVNWKATDYVKAYADLGRPDYIRYLDYLNNNYIRRSGLRLPHNVLHWAAFHCDIGNSSSKIKDGNLTFTKEQLEKANEMLDFFDMFKNVQITAPRYFFIALGYCTFFPEVDKGRLVKTVTSAKPRMFMSLGNIATTIEIIDEVYNYRLHGEKVHIKVLYSDYLDKIKKANFNI